MTEEKYVLWIEKDNFKFYLKFDDNSKLVGVLEKGEMNDVAKCFFEAVKDIVNNSMGDQK